MDGAVFDITSNAERLEERMRTNKHTISGRRTERGGTKIECAVCFQSGFVGPAGVLSGSATEAQCRHASSEERS